MYVIRENETNDYDYDIPFEDNIIDEATLSGELHNNDAQLAYQIILRNVSEKANDSAYIKPLLLFRDDRRCYLALKESFSSSSSK